MSRSRIKIDDALDAYLDGLLPRELPELERLREETGKLEYAQMQIGRDQGRFMTFLLRTLNARKTIEVGVFTGYSTLVTALALPEDGQVIACDISEEWTSVGRRYWKETGVDGKIDLRLGPAVGTLDAMLENGEQGNYDFAFIDADKTGYDDYYERCLLLLRQGGIIAIDNSLWGGSVTDPADQTEDTVAIRALNEKISQDERVEAYLAPIGDGIHLAWKQ